MKRTRLILTLIAVILLTAPLTALWVLGHSESTLRFLLGQIPAQFGTVERLQIRDVRGSLAGGFVIDAVEIDHDVFHLRLYGVRAKLELLPLLWQTIELRGLQADRVEILPQPRDRPPPNRPMRFLPGLLTLNAGDARVGLIEIRPARAAAVLFRDTTLNTLVRSDALQIRALRTQLGNITLDADGRLLAANPLGLDVDVRALYQPKRGPPWRATATVDGDLAAASFDARLLEPFTAQIAQGSLRLLLPWSVQGEATLAGLDLRKFGGSDFLGLIDGTLELEIDRNGYRAQGTVLPPGLAAGALEVDFDGRYSQGVLTARRFGVRHAPSGTRAVIDGRVTGTETGLQLELAGNWQQLRWPLADVTPPFRSERARFTLAGSGPYDLTVQGDAKIGALPVLQAALAATLQPGRLLLSRVEVEALAGTGNLTGEIQWRDAQRWRLAGAVRGLNPGQYRSGLQGKLDFELDARGRGFAADSTIDVEIKKIGGELRGAPARGSGRLSLAGSNLRFDKVDLAAGGLRMALDGSLSPRRNDLDFRIEASDLGVLVEGGRGRLRATGRLRGTPASMLIRLEAEGRDLALGDLLVGRLAADIDLDPQGGANATARAQVDATALHFAGRAADRLLLGVAGTAGRHTLAIDVSGTELALAARGEGSFASEGWQQRWNTLGLRLPDEIALALDAPLDLLLTTDSIAVEPFCLRGSRESPLTDQATLCGSGARRGDTWNLDAAIAKLPLASVLPNPATRARYEGSLSAVAALRGSAAGPPQGKLSAEFAGARLRWQRAGGKEELIPLGSGSLVFESDAQGISGNLDIAAGERGRARGVLRATLPPTVTAAATSTAAADAATAGLRDSAGWRDMPLVATLRADSTALALLYFYLPEIDRSAGDLSLDLVVGGTLGTPLVNGVLRLENGELDFYQINLALRDISAEARLLDNSFVLASTARAGRGSIAADAELTWTRGQPFGELRIKGENLTVIDVPEARIEASPDLRFRVDGRNLSASGSVLIPTARIVPADLTGAALTSDDEVLVGEEPRDPAASFRVSSNLRLTLGERVTLDSFGLSGRLAGMLNVVTAADGTSRGTGELGIAEGKYAALGRRLDIERGRLIFSGGLLADPGVDLRATKEFPDVRAGVNVRGTLREPRMTFFSEPSLPQSQVVSLILAGGTLESAQNSTLANSGRDALLAQGGAILAQQLGQRIGIEDVGIEQNLANETSLVFGKYLSSRLYVSYGVSLAEAINTLKLRYSINDRWTLRTEAGKEASAEIVYTVEKN